MRRGICIAASIHLALLVTACQEQTEILAGVAYRVPRDNLLQNTFAGQFVRSVYRVPEAEDEIGLVFDSEEVAAAIPGFHAQVPGYVGMVQASPAAVVSFSGPASNFDQMRAENVARLSSASPKIRYRQTEYAWPGEGSAMWNLSDEAGGWHRDDMLPPGCMTSKSQNGASYHSCSFNLRKKGFEYYFILSGENVAFADEFANFVGNKLASWKVGTAGR